MHHESILEIMFFFFNLAISWHGGQGKLMWGWTFSVLSHTFISCVYLGMSGSAQGGKVGIFVMKRIHLELWWWTVTSLFTLTVPILHSRPIILC